MCSTTDRRMTAPPDAGALSQLGLHYTQIPLGKQNFFPLDEMQAQGGYGRLLVWPDDILPTMSNVYLWDHQGVPRMWRTESDGAADVFLAGAAPGVGSGQWSNTGRTIRYAQVGIVDGGIFRHTVDAGLTTLYLVSMTVICTGLTGSNTYGNFTFDIIGSTGSLRIATLSYTTTPPLQIINWQVPLGGGIQLSDVGDAPTYTLGAIQGDVYVNWSIIAS